MTDWVEDLNNAEAADESSVLLTVVGVRGSAPREIGARMIVTGTQTIGTIGGGQLEYQCVQIACAQLRAGVRESHETSTRRFALGSGCGQCCGGVVEVMFEFLEDSRADWLLTLRELRNQGSPFVMATSTNDASCKFLFAEDVQMISNGDRECPDEIVAAAQYLMKTGGHAIRAKDYLLEPGGWHDFDVAVFGAGHVGAATVDALSRLDCRIRWIDGRRNMFPPAVPANVVAIRSDDPARESAAMPPGSSYLVMTHSHPLDLEICDRILRRDKFAYLGLIGSDSKRRRFERLLSKQGMPANLLDKLVCPVGVPGIEGKKPVEIAIAVAAEVLQVRDARIAKVAGPVQLKALG